MTSNLTPLTNSVNNFTGDLRFPHCFSRNMANYGNRTRVSMSSEGRNWGSEEIDLNDPQWSIKYQQDFERRFNLPHLKDVFKDLKSIPSTFCLRMR